MSNEDFRDQIAFIDVIQNELKNEKLGPEIETILTNIIRGKVKIVFYEQLVSGVCENSKHHYKCFILTDDFHLFNISTKYDAEVGKLQVNHITLYNWNTKKECRDVLPNLNEKKKDWINNDEGSNTILARMAKVVSQQINVPPTTFKSIKLTS